MTDAEVEVFIEKINVSKLEERDEQEVAGYFEALDTIGESYRDIDITEGNIKNIHKVLMKYCEKDEWHRGNYKQVSNAVEANHMDGSKQIIFKTTEPGLETEDAMRKLFEWYHTDMNTLPMVKSALFIYDFLSIHPFQDGNGRISRLLGTLLLLKHGYSWIQYVSFEHEIESRKSEYYKVLMQTQRQRPGEKVDDWVIFFLDCLLNIQSQLMDKLKTKDVSSQLGSKEKNILAFIENHPGSKSGKIAKKLDIPLPTVKKLLATLVETKLILKNGAGAGTNYIIELSSPVKTGLMFKLSENEIRKGFTLRNPNHYLEIKKIILLPLFEWRTPDEWSVKILNQGLAFNVRGITSRGAIFGFMNSLAAYSSPYLFEPVFDLHKPIHLPLSGTENKPGFNDYPLQVVIELTSTSAKFDFEVMFIYDEIG
jgi:Fic family protein